MPSVAESLLRALVPLKVVLLTEKPGREHAAIHGAITRAFQGGAVSADSVEAYFAAGEDLSVAVLDVAFAGDGAEARKVVENARASALHTVLVALLHDAPSTQFDTWLKELDDAAQKEPDDRPGLFLLPVTMREGVWRGNIQALNYATLGESALRPVYVAARVLAAAWRALGNEEPRLTLFISHAKLDGLPLAQSLEDQLNRFGGTSHFYDAKSIPPGSDWKRVLRKGVERAVLVSLRTNVYEERFWCVQEMDWAEDYGCPVVMVEARTQLVRAREFLPVGGAPCVQVPDGNLLRVLQSALREALRVRLFIRHVDALAELKVIDPTKVVKVPRASLATLGMRCHDRAESSTDVTHVFVPEPFREAHREVAEKLVRSYFPTAWLGTPRELAAMNV